ncbi:hypothetical protein FC093_11295 [Ilyomonas limi]|uniref:Uncharacterized protein n=1 Tax=Ilyomonas limi TaxID=2575867 RepID=A0A4U3L1X6_9BACT|nr:polysaccharide biosynthesis/export family protein [Ilyomonas limi]TKK68214.1 hypothetical protein FC093_11295 [Ilyomonas limi]
MPSLFVRALGLLLLPAICILSLSSCTTYRSVPYFHDLPDTARPTLAKTMPFKNPVIQPDDVLTITIQTIDNNVSALLNSANTVNGVTAAVPVSATTVGIGGLGQQAINGYLVDKDGYVELSFVGKVKVGGLTTAQAQDKIRAEVDKYFNNPVVNVRYANFKITVLGEVARPSSYVMPNEKVTIFDALGMAGDLTIFGKRENVLLLRDSSSTDNREMVRLNLNSKGIVSSPYFYLKPNDIIYVEPSKYKIASVDAVRTRNITILTSVLSFAVIIVSRINF